MRHALLLSGLALLPAPALAAPMLSGETELHIEATGTVNADYATYANTITISDHGKAGCEEKLRNQIADLRKGAEAVGVPATALTIEPGPCEARPANPEAPIPIEMPAPITTPVPVTAPPVDPAVAARMEALRKRNAMPWFDAKVKVAMRIDDVARFSSQKSRPFLFNAPLQFHFDHEEDVPARAYADAMAKASHDADLLARQLGGHVVRVARVSNHGAPITMVDVGNMIATIAGKFEGMPQAFLATRSVSLAIDYIIAPN